MSFISYAQNLEDVMLWRALKNIDKGFYVDVGANDPSIDSVTKHFYLQGWRGINIDPLRQHIEALEVERPRDLNLQLAIGKAEGEIKLWETDIRGWATANIDVVKRHERYGHVGQWHTVRTSTLESVLKEHGAQEIHFLKVDVEGMEEEVLASNDWSTYRPWIVVVEATLPVSQIESYQSWELILTAANYLFAYADGLNRFYVAKEHLELLPSFKYPPNVFDGYKVAGWVDDEKKMASAELRASAAEFRALSAEERAAKAELYLANILNSTSWRLIEPLRFVWRNLKVGWHFSKRVLKKVLHWEK